MKEFSAARIVPMSEETMTLGVKVMKEFSAARIVPMSLETMTLWVLWLSIFVGLFFNLYGPGGDRG